MSFVRKNLQILKISLLIVLVICGAGFLHVYTFSGNYLVELKSNTEYPQSQQLQPLAPNCSDLPNAPANICDPQPSPRRQPTHKKNLHDKWIIVTSISSPTKQIKKLSSIPGWQLLVVADRKTPTNWSFPNSIFLSMDAQLNLNYLILKHLPWNSYTRKNIGYLYAIEHGAKVIYDTDDDNAPDGNTFENNFALKTTTGGCLISISPKNNISINSSYQYKAINPYAHFGQRTIWPRGYPLEKIADKEEDTENSCTICRMRSPPAIQQGLVNGDPDVDAIFRLTRKSLESPLNIQFDGVAPPMIYPEDTFAPFNSQNTIFHHSAFWGLLLPISVSFRVTDIWRGYWAQPLLWLIGENLGFYSPHTTQIRNAHRYLNDFKEEDQMYIKTGLLLQLLTEWKCESKGFYDCMRNLTELMVQREMWGVDQTALVNAWISDLKSVGYQEPNLKSGNSPCSNEKKKTFGIFHPTEIESKESKSNNMRKELRKLCNFSMTSTASQIPSNSIFPSTLLVVTFNFPFFQNVWLLELIYRPHYPNILYCGNLKKHSEEYRALLRSKPFVAAGVEGFSVIDVDVRKGYFAYDCAIKAIEMNYGVSSYLVLSDDVLLNFWNTNTRAFNPDEMWSIWNWNQNMTPMNTELPAKSVKWNWWAGPLGINASRKALQTVYTSKNKEFLKFTKFRGSYGLNGTTMAHALADIFYLPAKKQDIFYEIATILRDSEVFLEIAVPFLVSGITSFENHVRLKGSIIWGRNRNDPFKFFNETANMLHPVKLSKVVGNMELRNKYCGNYVAKILSL